MGFSEQAGAELHSAWILIKKTQIFVIILPATAGAGPEAGSLATAYPADKELWGWGEDTVSPLGGPNVTAISPAHHPARKGWQPVSQLLSPSTRCPKELPLLLLCVPVPQSPHELLCSWAEPSAWRSHLRTQSGRPAHARLLLLPSCAGIESGVCGRGTWRGRRGPALALSGTTFLPALSLHPAGPSAQPPRQQIPTCTFKPKLEVPLPALL